MTWEMMVWGLSRNGNSSSGVSYAFKHFLLRLSSCLTLSTMDGLDEAD